MNNGRVKKQSYYKPRPNSRPKYVLEVGQRGFFCTCNFREKDCVKEAYNILNEYGDKLYGSTKENQNRDDDNAAKEEAGCADPSEAEDISDQLNREIQDMKSQSKKNIWEKRFQAVETGAANCVFIRTNLTNPEEITSQLFKDLMETKVARARFLLRIVPIMATCKANLLDVTQTAGKLFDDHFLKEPSTFSIVFNRRYHNTLTRDDVIKALADLITLKNSGNKADLKNPQKAVIVEIIKGICLMSVVEKFYEYRKYNMFEVCKKEEDKSTEEAKTEGGGNEQDDEEKEKSAAVEDGKKMDTESGDVGNGDEKVDGHEKVDGQDNSTKINEINKDEGKIGRDGGGDK